MSLGVRVCALVPGSLAGARLAWLLLHSSEDFPFALSTLSSLPHAPGLCFAKGLCLILMQMMQSRISGGQDGCGWQSTAQRDQGMRRKPGFECGQLLAAERAAKCQGNSSPNRSHAVLRVVSSKITDQHFSTWSGELPAPGRTWR